MKMKHLAVAGLFALSTQSAFAQDDSKKFSGIDALLRSMTDKMVLDQDKQVMPPTVVEVAKLEKKAEFKEGNVISNPLDVSEPKKDKPHLAIRFSEMPPNARFEFTKDIFIPAYKAGVILEKGVPVLNIEPDTDLAKLFSQPLKSKDTCAILSDKSYVFMRGSSGETSPTWLTVSKIEIRKFSNNETKEMASAAYIQFEEKGAKATDASVNLSLICLLQPEFTNAIHDYRLSNLDEALGGLFTITLPRFIEL